MKIYQLWELEFLEQRIFFIFGSGSEKILAPASGQKHWFCLRTRARADPKTCRCFDQSPSSSKVSLFLQKISWYQAKTVCKKIWRPFFRKTCFFLWKLPASLSFLEKPALFFFRKKHVFKKSVFEKKASKRCFLWQTRRFLKRKHQHPYFR